MTNDAKTGSAWETRAFDMTITFDDHVAFYRHMFTQPLRLALQAAIFSSIGIYLLFLKATIDMVTFIFGAGGTVLGAARTYAATRMWVDLVQGAPWIALFCAVFFVLNLFVFIPRQSRMIARRILAGYPEIISGDPQMRLHGRIKLAPDGLEVTTLNERYALAWANFRHLVETRRFMFIMTNRSSGIIIPKHSMDAETSNVFRAHVIAALTPASGAKP